MGMCSGGLIGKNEALPSPEASLGRRSFDLLRAWKANQRAQRRQREGNSAWPRSHRTRPREGALSRCGCLSRTRLCAGERCSRVVETDQSERGLVPRFSLTGVGCTCTAQLAPRRGKALHPATTGLFVLRDSLPGLDSLTPNSASALPCLLILSRSRPFIARSALGVLVPSFPSTSLAHTGHQAFTECCWQIGPGGSVKVTVGQTRAPDDRILSSLWHL
ncbi:hypothetical protein BCR34DRAFT_304792 [Clohesyomyces aquaticus]|uniref:Uncharacterized protein n=1 Tax=Clohesyomyces aquaticus TaxID=1231657 RepID=A0A1Y1ZPK4_9PLEO|nr:hypothetical protein BCR34DRAFT_304792 [Clohesyomyces aquaticus]